MPDPAFKGKRLRTTGPSEAMSRRCYRKLGRMHRLAQCFFARRRRGSAILLQDGASESPMGRVPNRTWTAHSRLRVGPGSKYDHPPAAQPRHRSCDPAEFVVEGPPPSRSPALCQTGCAEGVQVALSEISRCPGILH